MMNDKCQTCGRKLQLIHLGKGKYECYQCRHNPIGSVQGVDKRIENERLFTILKDSTATAATSKRKAILVTQEVLEYAVRSVERSLLLHKRLEKKGHEMKEWKKNYRQANLDRKYYKYEYQAAVKEIEKLKESSGEQ